jgi:hypothetical protein
MEDRSTEMGRWTMGVTTFEVRSAGRAVALVTASSAPEALIDYLRALGCRDSEIVRLGSNAAAWRGATYRVTPAAGSDSRAA